MDNREKQIRLAEQLIATGIDGELKKAIENQFPELKIREDERIREQLLQYFKERRSSGDADESWYGLSYDSIISYLERQKVETISPKFNIGDTIRFGKTEYTIKEVLDNYYIDASGRNLDMNYTDHKFELANQIPTGEDESSVDTTEWSEEDEQYLLVCKNALNKYQRSDNWDASIISNWLENRLKSFRPQPHWKPSEEQMKALEQAMDRNDKLGYLLRELHDKLKNL